MAERVELGTPLGQAEACITNGETDGSPGASPHRVWGMAERAKLGTPLGQAEACTTNGDTDGSPGGSPHRVWVFERLLRWVAGWMHGWLGGLGPVWRCLSGGGRFPRVRSVAIFESLWRAGWA